MKITSRLSEQRSCLSINTSSPLLDEIEDSETQKQYEYKAKEKPEKTSVEGINHMDLL